MYPHLLKVQVVMALLVAIGGYVLGNSIADPDIVRVSLAGPLVAFIIVDRLKWIDLSGWAANLVLVVILVYSMRDFIGGDSAAKLTSVAVLLSYLLVALCFQKKTPRLGWQILVLSILQMLEAAIFNLNFEYGLFFVMYFIVATFSLILQNDYSEWLKMHHRNRLSRKTADGLDLTSNLPSALAPALVLSKLQPSQNLLNKFKVLLPWLAGSLVFSFILFHSLPHTRQDWGEQNTSDFSVTGHSETVELKTDGIVSLSNKLIFRARFLDLKKDENISLVGKPYFRGMAMSRLRIENDQTKWEAPYEHVFSWSYKILANFNPRSASNVRLARIEVVVEPTPDPLIYSTMPVYRKLNGESEVEFCRDLSALTRRNSRLGSTIASYKYDLTTLLDAVNRPLKGFPYISTDGENNFPTMEDGSPEHQLLTDIPKERYPALVETAQSISNQYRGRSDYDIANAMLNHFSFVNGYEYTIDYRNVSTNPELDVIEDFVSNHRKGHCSIYASALTLMLRSAGIPARYVIGYYGGRYNSLTDCYVVTGRHAHAWVEAYIPPEECPESLFKEGIASRKSGAWITLDPTPLSAEDDTSSEALDLARSIWQDYVISPDHNKQAFSDSNTLFMTTNKNSRVGEYVERFFDSMTANRLTQGSLILFTIALVLYPVLQNSKRNNSNVNRMIVNPIRQWISNKIVSISPQMANWVAGQSIQQIEFYRRFEQLIQNHLGLTREQGQTQREFALAAGQEVMNRDFDEECSHSAVHILEHVTDRFYQARFSSIPLDKSTVDDIENQIQNLEKILKTGKS